MKNTLRVTLCAFATVVMVLATGADAQSWPTRPIRLLVGQPPGGPTDLGARVYADRMRAYVGQPVVVENRPGAAAQISIIQTAQAEPNGYTLNYSGPGPATLPWLSRTYTIDSFKDLTAISLISAIPVAIAASTSMNVRTLDEFIADLKANPGRRNYANLGATDFLQMELFRRAAGVEFTTVRFNGAAPGLQSLLAGDVHFTYTTIGTLKPYADAGKLRMLAVTGSVRNGVVPDVPAISESSLPAVAALAKNTFSGSWFGLIGPAGLPQDVVAKLADATIKVTREPEFIRRMRDLALEPIGSTPAEFAARLKHDYEVWGKTVKEMKFEPQ